MQTPHPHAKLLRAFFNNYDFNASNAVTGDQVTEFEQQAAKAEKAEIESCHQLATVAASIFTRDLASVDDALTTIIKCSSEFCDELWKGGNPYYVARRFLEGTAPHYFGLGFYKKLVRDLMEDVERQVKDPVGNRYRELYHGTRKRSATMRVTEHRGALDEAMQTETIIESTAAALQHHISKNAMFGERLVEVAYYGYDDRIRQERFIIIVADASGNRGVWGFCDMPIIVNRIDVTRLSLPSQTKD